MLFNYICRARKNSQTMKLGCVLLKLAVNVKVREADSKMNIDKQQQQGTKIAYQSR